MSSFADCILKDFFYLFGHQVNDIDFTTLCKLAANHSHMILDLFIHLFIHSFIHSLMMMVLFSSSFGNEIEGFSM